MLLLNVIQLFDLMFFGIHVLFFCFEFYCCQLELTVCVVCFLRCIISSILPFLWHYDIAIYELLLSWFCNRPSSLSFIRCSILLRVGDNLLYIIEIWLWGVLKKQVSELGLAMRNLSRLRKARQLVWYRNGLHSW